MRVDGRELLASASADTTVRIWDPATGATERILDGHSGGLRGVCAVRVDGRELLASASTDRTVRIWDPAISHALQVIAVHYEALGLVSFNDGSLIVGSSVGLLALSVTRAASTVDRSHCAYESTATPVDRVRCRHRHQVVGQGGYGSAL